VVSVMTFRLLKSVKVVTDTSCLLDGLPTVPSSETANKPRLSSDISDGVNYIVKQIEVVGLLPIIRLL
jgi:hypothetical protein